MNTKRIGDTGEEIAREYLVANGYKILEQNFIACGCEVDIICQDTTITDIKQSFLAKLKNRFSKKIKDESNCNTNRVAKSIAGNKGQSTKPEPTIVFVEVKTRANEKYGSPLEAVTKAKQKRYVRAAKSYIVQKQKVNLDIRFDVIEVLDGKMTHIKSAFEC